MAGASQGATVPCELLEWDSEHFGFPIARVASDALTPHTAEAIDDWARQGNPLPLLPGGYRRCGDRPGRGPHGYRMVDLRVTDRRSMEGVGQLPTGGPETMVREAVEEDLDYLRPLAGRSHRTSRFYFDGRFPQERCDALYPAWVERGFRDPDRTSWSR